MINAAREQGWNRIEFLGSTIRPMLEDGEHDCEARAARVREAKGGERRLGVLTITEQSPTWGR